MLKKQNKMSIDIRVPFYYLQLITLIIYNTYWIISILSNLHFVKDFLKMDQGGVSIHRINDLFPLKPPLTGIPSIELKAAIENRFLFKESGTSQYTTFMSVPYNFAALLRCHL